MKNKVKVLIIIVLGLFLTGNIERVEASTARYTSGSIIPNLKYGNGDNYKNNYFSVDGYGEGYCLDAGYGVGNGTFQVTCNQLEDYTTAKAFKYVIDSNNDQAVKQLAVRFLAQWAKISRSGWDHTRYINEYVTSGGVSGLTGSSPVLSQAYQLYKKAIASVGKKGENVESKLINKIILTEKRVTVSADKNSIEVEYEVSTFDGSPIDVDFQCKECSSINHSGKKLVVTINQPTCKYNIEAYYESDSTDIFMCTPPPTIDNQRILAFKPTNKTKGIVAVENGTEVTKPNQTFSKSISEIEGGEYWAKYCDNGGDGPGPNNCNGPDGKTTVDIPEYCDSSENNIAKINGPTKINSCVIRSRDEGGASYQDTTLVDKSNKYCSVYCKEDYTMSLPKAKYTNSGRYFKLEDTKVKGTRSCYISGAADNGVEGIDLNQFRTDVQDAQRALVDAYNSYAEANTAKNGGGTYNKYTINNCNANTGSCSLNLVPTSVAALEIGDITSLKNSFNAAKNKLNDILNQMSACYSWANEWDQVELKDDKTQDQFCFDPKMKFDYSEEEYKSDYKKIGESKVSDKKVSVGSSVTSEEYTLAGGGSIKESIPFVECLVDGVHDGCNNEGNTRNNISSTVRFIEASITKEAKYNNKQEFQANYPHGTIETVPDNDKDKVKENYSYLGAILPVALKTKTGVYNWHIDFTKIGQYNDSSSCKTGRLNEAVKAMNKNITANLGYVCFYVVDCPECEVSCSCDDLNLPEGWLCTVTKNDEGKQICEISNDDNCPECEVHCIDCIFDGNEVYNYRTISTSDINPNNRTMGYNWTNEKGKETKKLIEDPNSEALNKPQYSFTITPANMKAIRDYNNETGSYVDEDLEYKSMTKDNKKYKNVYGTSKFLRNSGNKFFDTSKLNNKWILWEGTINTNGSGPSWK